MLLKTMIPQIISRESRGVNKIIILLKSLIESCGVKKVWGKNTRKMNIVIKDETEERLRRAIADYMGVKKGNISKAIEEAINLWIDRKSEIHRRGQGKAKNRW